MRNRVLLMLCLLAACDVAAAAPAEAVAGKDGYARAGELLIRIPDGWTLTDNQVGGNYVLTPPNVPALEQAKIVISPVSKPLPTLRDQMLGEIEAGQKIPQFKLEGEITPIAHPAGYEMLGLLVSFKDKPAYLFTLPNSWAMLVHVAGGEEVPSIPIMLYTTNKELLDQHLPAFNTFVSELRLPSRTILAERPGHPPLTLRTAQHVGDFLEWLLEVPFTEAQRETLQQYLIQSWQQGDAEGIEGVRTVLDFRKKLEELTADQKTYAREAARAEALKLWRVEAQQGDVMAKMMVEMYDGARAALVPGGPGEPPLTRQSTDASLEILYFMASKAVDPSTRGFVLYPPQEQKDQWAKELASNYAALPAGQKQEIAEMASTWAGLRMLWPELSGEQRAALAAGWAQTPPVQALVPAVKKGAESARMRELAQTMRSMDAHQQLIWMGAYRLNYRYVYR